MPLKALSLKHDYFLVLLIVGMLSACRDSDFADRAEFTLNGKTVLLHNKNYLGAAPQDQILQIDGQELLLGLSPELFESKKGLYWKVEDETFSVVSTEKKIDLKPWTGQGELCVSLCEGLSGPCVSAFIAIGENAGISESQENDWKPSHPEAQATAGSSEKDPEASPSVDKPILSSGASGQATGKNQAAQSTQGVSQTGQNNSNAITDAPSSSVSQPVGVRDEGVNKPPVENSVQTMKVEENKKTEIFSPSATGLLNKVSSLAALNDESETITMGAITIKPSRNLILFESKLKVEGHGKIEFSLSGDGIKREISTIKNVNDGLNTIRFTDLKHTVLMAGKTYVLQYECQGDVKAVIIKGAFSGGSSNADVSLSGKQILYDFTYKY